MSIVDALSLRGKVALVTGGGRGIGREIALGLADAGAAVIVADLERQSAEETAAEIRARGARATSIGTDVTEEDRVKDMFRRATEWKGHIDVLVNNVGTTIQKAAIELTLDEWSRVLSVNLTATFLCCRHVAPIMMRDGGGSIVNLGSINGIVAPAFHASSAYAAAKAGVLGLTRALAVEWGPKAIRVNAVCPTYVRTKMTEARLNDQDYFSRIVSRTPLGKVADPADIAGAVLFLASPASGMVTGQALPVDGGWTIV